MRAAQATPFRMSHPTHPPPNASPVHRSAVRALAPSSPIASNRLTYIRSFVNFTSAQRWRLHIGRGAGCDSTGRPSASTLPRPIRHTKHSTIAQVTSKETRAGGGTTIIRKAPPMRAGHATPRHASCSFCVAAPRRERLEKWSKSGSTFGPKTSTQSHGSTLQSYQRSGAGGLQTSGPISHSKAVNVTASFLSAKVTHFNRASILPTHN